MTHSPGSSPKAPTTFDFSIAGAFPEFEIVVTEVNASERRTAYAFPARTPEPKLAGVLPPVSGVTALDLLEHVVDEQVLLREMASLLQPGGELVARVPAEGPLAWLDARNLYRYVQDTAGIGTRLVEAKKRGWNRHYHRADLAAMLEEQGLVVRDVVRSGSPLHDVAHLAGLVWGDGIRKDADASGRLDAWRKAAESGPDRARLGPLSTTITMRAVKPA